MDLVLVYLREVKEYVIVPETYINGYGPDFLKGLKNQGNNCNRDHLVFYSDQCVEGHTYPEPDPNAKISETFPPIGSSWYNGRTILFTDNFEEATIKRDKKRKVTPGVYNQAKLKQKPLPLMVLCSDNQHSEEEEEEAEHETMDPLADDDTNDSSKVSTTDRNDSLEVTKISNDLSLNLSLVNNPPEVHSDDVATANESSLYVTAQTLNETICDDVTENATGLDIEHGSLGDAQITNENICNRSSEPSSSERNEMVNLQANVPIKPEPQFPDMDGEDLEAVEEILNDSYEALDDDVMIRRNDVMPPPIPPKLEPYQVKANDIVSGNLPFATDLGARSYIISDGKSFKQVNFPKRIVDSLLSFNSTGFRENAEYDAKFFKVVLVACFGGQQVLSKELDPLIKGFIKDLFAVRKGGDMSNFDNIFDAALKDVKLLFAKKHSAKHSE